MNEKELKKKLGKKLGKPCECGRCGGLPFHEDPDRFNHGTLLGIRSMLARYGMMTIDDYYPIFLDLEGLTKKQQKEYFDDLVGNGFIKEIKINRKTYYESIPEKESKRVKEIADSDDEIYFDELG